MCTHYTLTYKCGHTQTSRRCPLTTTTYTSASGGTVTYTKECGNVLFLGGTLDDDCMDCKLASGMAPGLQTGFEVWADMRNLRGRVGRQPEMRWLGNLSNGGGDGDGGGNGGNEANEEESLDPRLGGGLEISGAAGYSERRAATNGSGGMQGQNQLFADFDGTGKDGMVANAQDTENVEGRLRAAFRNDEERAGTNPVAPEDDQDWMWGGLQGFGDEESKPADVHLQMPPSGKKVRRSKRRPT